MEDPTGVVHFVDSWKHAAVSLPDPIDNDDTLHAATYDLLQQALDVRSVSDAQLVEDEEALELAILWRRLDSGFHVTIKELASLSIRVEVSWEKSREGVVVERSEDQPDPQWHESFRFLRRAASAQDVFDAYRNTYLALESLLADAYPQKAGEGEVAWIKRAIKNLSGTAGLDLSLYTLGDPTPGTWVQEHYEAFRCALFHAKTHVGLRRLPARFEDWALVSEALSRLHPMVIELVQKIRSVGIATGGLTYAGMRVQAEAIAGNGYALGRASDSSPVDKADVELSPQGLDVRWVAGTWSGRPHGRPDLYRFEATEEQLLEQTPMVIGRIGMRVGGGTLMTVTSIDSLDLSGVASYRHILDFGFWSASLGRSPFRP